MKNFKFDTESIIKLWQNPYYKNVLLNIFSVVNYYLWNNKLRIEKSLFESLNKEFGMSTIDFEKFVINYINSLTKILYKTPQESIILYRGESRSILPDFKKGDIMLYKNFHSTSDNISFAYNFSLITSSSKYKLLLVLKIPSGYHYRKLNKSLEFTNSKLKITEYYDEFEYLIPPNSYYRVVSVTKLSENTFVIKGLMVLQEKHLIEGTEYRSKELPLERTKDFKDTNYDKFVKEYKNYEKSLESLKKLYEFQINQTVYSILSRSNNEDIFKLDLDFIQEKSKLITEETYQDVLTELERVGFIITENKSKNKSQSKSQIDLTIKKLRNLAFFDFNSIQRVEKLKVYTGYDNYLLNLQVHSLISQFEKSDVGTINLTIKTNIIPDCYYYNCVTNDMYPRVSIKKNGKKTLIYKKHIIEFYLKNVKIVTSDQIVSRNDSYILLIPNFEYKIIEKIHGKNKFGLKIIQYKIELVGI